MARRRQLFSANITADGIRLGIWRAASMAIVFFVSIPVAVVAPAIAPFIWLSLLPLRFLRWSPMRRGRPARRSR